MTPLIQLPDKVDVLKHFQRNCAIVKLLALLLVVVGRFLVAVAVVAGVLLVTGQWQTVWRVAHAAAPVAAPSVLACAATLPK